MATGFSCSSCRHAQAAGQCPACSIVLCQACYNTHQCGTQSAPEPEPAANLQCLQCHTEPATGLCLCKFPCQVFCDQCYVKHSGGLPIHFKLPMRYQGRLRSIEEFRTRKARYANMQRLYTDITSTVVQIGDFRRIFENKLADVADQLESLRRKMTEDIEKAQSAMQQEESYLSNYFTEILMSSEPRSSSELTRLIDTNYPSSSTFEHQLIFDPVLTALSQAASFNSPLLDTLRPQLPPQTPALVLPRARSFARICNVCGQGFTSQPASDIEPMQKISGIWEDFCSLTCLERVKEIFLS